MKITAVSIALMWAFGVLCLCLGIWLQDWLSRWPKVSLAALFISELVLTLAAWIFVALVLSIVITSVTTEVYPWILN